MGVRVIVEGRGVLEVAVRVILVEISDSWFL